MEQRVWVVWRLVPAWTHNLEVHILGTFDSEAGAIAAIRCPFDHITEAVMNKVNEWPSGCHTLVVCGVGSKA